MTGSTMGVVVFHSRLDRALPVAHAEAITTAIPNASMTIVDTMGHIPRLDDWLMIADRLDAMPAPRC